MQNKNIDFYYFSGTGNTLLVVKEMAKVFEEDQCQVSFHKIEHADPREVSTDKSIGLAFPVAVQSTYPLVWSFIDQLPPGNGTEIFMVDTMFYFSGGVVGPLKNIVEAKGYIPIGAKEIKMPYNFYPKRINQEKTQRIIENGLQVAQAYAISLLQGTAHWRRISFLGTPLYLIARSRLALNFLRNIGKKLTVNQEKCTQCELCVKLCPINNVRMNEYPEFCDNCEQCMRCVSFCPKNAILLPHRQFRQYKAVKAAELLK